MMEASGTMEVESFDIQKLVIYRPEVEKDAAIVGCTMQNNWYGLHGLQSDDAIKELQIAGIREFEVAKALLQGHKEKLSQKIPSEAGGVHLFDLCLTFGMDNTAFALAESGIPGCVLEAHHIDLGSYLPQPRQPQQRPIFKAPPPSRPHLLIQDAGVGRRPHANIAHGAFQLTKEYGWRISTSALLLLAVQQWRQWESRWSWRFWQWSCPTSTCPFRCRRSLQLDFWTSSSWAETKRQLQRWRGRTLFGPCAGGTLATCLGHFPLLGEFSWHITANNLLSFLQRFTPVPRSRAFSCYFAAPTSWNQLLFPCGNLCLLWGGQSKHLQACCQTARVLGIQNRSMTWAVAFAQGLGLSLWTGSMRPQCTALMWKIGWLWSQPPTLGWAASALAFWTCP